jgi:RNA polymerase sigma-70 factor (ECF subfamily)
MPSDLQLLQRYATTGDAHAFRELVQAHGAMVHATALRVTGDAAAAQDVAQETFLELGRMAGGITQSVAAWLHRVSWNRACDVVRRETARKRVEEAMAETWHTDREATWPDIAPHVDASLNELPNELREVLVLYFLEGQTQAEVAQHLSRNQATVSRAIERGISAMREALRSRGVTAGAGLAALFTAQSAQAMPVAVQASLGKLSLTGIGTTPTIPAASVTTTLITMTATTKALLITGAIAAATLPFVLHHPANKSMATNAPKTVRQATPEIPAVPQGTDQSKRYRPVTMPESVRRKADGVAARHRGMTKEQFEQSDEIKQLGERFGRHLEPPEFQKKVQQAIEELQAVKGIEHGTLNFDLHDLTSPIARAWLEAALSDDPQPAQDYVMNLLDGAVFEFAFDPGSDSSSDGLIVKGENPSRSPTDKQSLD